jgi:aminoglycoside phosphotransferase
MTDKKDDLPVELYNLVGDYSCTLQYETVAKTFLLTANNRANKYLKIQPVGYPNSLEQQSKRLLWLTNKLPVPEIIDYGITGGYEYLITYEISGYAASNEIFKKDTKEMIALIAKGLREIHELSISDCPFDNSINKLMTIAQYNIQNRFFDPVELQNKFGEDSIEKLLREVELFSDVLTEDLVFTHGDYSLPNIIIKDGTIEGYLDLGNCGMADRYYDLAVAEKSIIRNFGSEYLQLFYEQYGISKSNTEKIRFYQLMEHLLDSN